MNSKLQFNILDNMATPYPKFSLSIILDATMDKLVPENRQQLQLFTFHHPVTSFWCHSSTIVALVNETHQLDY